MPVLALFDFDGTLTKQDSFPAFLKFAVGKRKFWWGMFLISPFLVLYFLRLIPNHVAKMIVLRYFLEGWSIDQLERTGKEFSEKIIPNILRRSGMEKLQWHKEQGHRIILITASVDWWIKPWADEQGVELICTRMKQVSGVFTGEYETPNCYGAEKVRRLKTRIQGLDLFEDIYAYGDSKGDKEMLSIAKYPHYKPWTGK
jgi:phosphatidylglycerophosphatase C